MFGGPDQGVRLELLDGGAALCDACVWLVEHPESLDAGIGADRADHDRRGPVPVAA